MRVNARLTHTNKPPEPPLRYTLVEVHGAFQKWLGEDYDVDALDATCAAGACARLTGDPLWLLIISGPGRSLRVRWLGDADFAQA